MKLLDLGRSVFWQQASSLRSDLETLRDEEPELANELENVGRMLDAGNFSSSFLTIDEQSIVVNGRENIRKECHHLAGVWEGLVERVRQLPRFEYFLKPIPFRQLCSAATTGRVVIINISEYGMDALIFDAFGPIEHVPLPEINLRKLTELSSNIALNQSSDAQAIEDDRGSQQGRFVADNLQATL